MISSEEGRGMRIMEKPVAKPKTVFSAEPEMFHMRLSGVTRQSRGGLRAPRRHDESS